MTAMAAAVSRLFIASKISRCSSNEQLPAVAGCEEEIKSVVRVTYFVIADMSVWLLVSLARAI